MSYNPAFLTQLTLLLILRKKYIVNALCRKKVNVDRSSFEHDVRRKWPKETNISEKILIQGLLRSGSKSPYWVYLKDLY